MTPTNLRLRLLSHESLTTNKVRLSNSLTRLDLVSYLVTLSPQEGIIWATYLEGIHRWGKETGCLHTSTQKPPDL